MDFRVLGPLEVTAGGRTLGLGAAKQQALLAVLLLHPNQTVSATRLIDELWGESPIASLVEICGLDRVRLCLASARGGRQAVSREHLHDPLGRA
jgi:hypothetical protein